MRIRVGTALIFLAGGPLFAETPLSAIDWLEATPTVQAVLPAPNAPKPDEPDTARTATAPTVKVMPLGTSAAPSAIGLIPSSVTGLPDTLWQGSSTATLARRIDRLPDVGLPALQSLLFAMMLTETKPLSDTVLNDRLLQARIGYLVDKGALDPALDLMGRVGAFDKANLAQTWFDLSLLADQSDMACPAVATGRSAVQGSEARIYCLARSGKWDDAAILLNSGIALDLIAPYDAQLLSHFLEPELAEDEPLTSAPTQPTPMQFTLLAALGEPVPTGSLPIVFANTDLGEQAGWKSQLLAAERLAKAGAMPANRLLGLYTQREPAASGGLWDRVEALQRFEVALRTRSPDAIAKTLPAAWPEMSSAGLGATFAQLFADDLAQIPLTGAAASVALDVALVSPDYARLVPKLVQRNPSQQLASGLAMGTLPDATGLSPVEAAIHDAFTLDGTANRITRLAENGDLGTALMMAIARVHDGAQGDLESLTVGLSALRALGREEDAKRAALQVLVLDRS